MAVAMIGPKFYAWDKNGKPLAFGKLYTYQARTNVPKDTYQSEDQVVANTNPVILNGEGYANIYLDGSYKMVLKDSDENEIWSADPVSSAEVSEWVLCLSAAYLSPTSLKVGGNFTEEYEEGRRVRIDNNTTEYSYSTIVSSVFASGETTITISDPVITTGVVGVCRSVIGLESVVVTPEYIKTLEHISIKTLNEASTDTSVEDGDYIRLSDRDNELFQYKTGQTPDEKGIITCTGVAALSLVIQPSNGVVSIKALGASGDGVQSTKAFHEVASTYAKVIRFPISEGEVYNYSSAPTLSDDVVSYISDGSKVTGINAINSGFTIESLPLANSTIGSDSIDIKWNYDGEPVSISLAGNSIREHCIVWHPGKRTYYLIGDVLANASPYWPNTYDSEIGLWKCNDPETLQSWTYLGICIPKGTGKGQGEFGAASAAGADVLDSGSIVVPFSSRDTGAPSFTERSIGMAISSGDPDVVPWTKRSGFISDVSLSDDDPAIVRDIQTDLYHLFHRSTDNFTDYRISHLYTTDPVNGVWLQTDDANDLTPYPSVTAQEVTGAFMLDGVCNLWTMEQGPTQPATAWWVSKSNMLEFKPKDSLNRHLPASAFGKGTLDPANGHASPIVREGKYIGTSFTVNQAVGQYGVNINLIDTDLEKKRLRVALTGDQVVPTGVSTVLELDGILHDTVGTWFDAGTYTFTPLVEGYYRFVGGALLVALGDGVRAILELQKNGSRVAGLDMRNNGATQDMRVEGDSGLIYANGVNDSFTLNILQQDAGNVTVRDDDTWTFLDIILEERKYNA